MRPALIAAALAAPLAALGYLYRRPLPKINGRLHMAGLSAPVEVIRDRWGVPHIYAGNLEDLLFAQGFVHAQDRLWQMELNRRLGHGRLAEAFGEIAYPTDRLLRILGFSRAARQDLGAADVETRRVLESYVRGINAFIGAKRTALPLEFSLLGLKPEPWQALDSFVWGKVMSWSLAANWSSEVMRAALIGRVGAERAARLHGEYPADNPVCLPDQAVVAVVDRLLEQFRAAEAWLPAKLQGTSNNWVVDGTKSTSGQPLLANDMHLALQMPSIWYENHLVCPTLEVTGVTFPGVPGVVVGHNADIAWGPTTSFPDVQDLYVERFSPDDPTLYEYEGAWERATVEREEIRVKGEREPRLLDVRVTRHGPIVDELHPLASENVPTGVSLRWVGYEPGRMLCSVLRLNRARDWPEFRAALEDWTDPSVSLVYADRAGNIGYYMPGRVPIRAKGLGIVPVPGWTGEYEWTGWIPHAELPHAFNPEQHYLLSTNNRVVGEDYPHFLTTETMNGFRARRIAALLREKDRHAVDDFARIQLDQYCAPAKTLCGLLTALADQILSQPALSDSRSAAKGALDALGRWDHRLSAASVEGAIFEVAQYFAMRRVFGPWLGDLTDHYLGVGFHPLLAAWLLTIDRASLVLHQILLDNASEWFRDAEGNGQIREEVLALALRDAIRYLRQECGDDIGQWQWGRIHRVGFNHPLGAKKPLDRIFNRGPYPYGGDTNTVCQAAFLPTLPLDSEGALVPSWRQIIDLSDWDASLGVHNTGQSGHPASKHYADMIPMWLKGEYHPLLWTREKVEAHAEARLTLLP